MTSLKSFATFAAAVGITLFAAAGTAQARGNGGSGMGSHGMENRGTANRGTANRDGEHRSPNHFDNHDRHRDHDWDRYGDYRYGHYPWSFCYSDYCRPYCFAPSYCYEYAPPCYAPECPQYCVPSCPECCAPQPYCCEPPSYCPEYCPSYSSCYGFDHYRPWYDKWRDHDRDHRQHDGPPRERSQSSHSVSQGMSGSGSMASHMGGSHGSRR